MHDRITQQRKFGEVIERAHGFIVGGVERRRHQHPLVGRLIIEIEFQRALDKPQFRQVSIGIANFQGVVGFKLIDAVALAILGDEPEESETPLARRQRMGGRLNGGVEQIDAGVRVGRSTLT